MSWHVLVPGWDAFTARERLLPASWKVLVLRKITGEE